MKLDGSFLTKNFSYKVVALFVSLALWVTLIGRRGRVQTHTMELKVLLGPELVVKNRIPKRIRVKLKGNRDGLEKFSSETSTYTLDLAYLKPGMQQVEISKDSFKLPLGVKVIQVRPDKIMVDVRKAIAAHEQKK